MENKNAISAAYPTYFHNYSLKFKTALGISLLITNDQFYIHISCHQLDVCYNYYYCHSCCCYMITIKKYLSAKNIRVRNSIKQIREWQLDSSFTDSFIQDNTKKCFVMLILLLLMWSIHSLTTLNIPDLYMSKPYILDDIVQFHIDSGS